MLLISSAIGARRYDGDGSASMPTRLRDACGGGRGIAVRAAPRAAEIHREAALHTTENAWAVGCAGEMQPPHKQRTRRSK
jgi:hypothetical protein